MPSASPLRISLQAHPGTHCEAVQGITVEAATERDSLLFRYVLEADLSLMRIPEPVAPCRADELWKHTCFEVFIGDTESGAYDELNFSPSTQWAAYRFSAYRQGMTPLPLEQAPAICVTRSDRALTLQVTVLPPQRLGAPRRRSRLAFAAVMELENGTLSYWAGRHPRGNPDFHHPESFAFEL